MAKMKLDQAVRNLSEIQKDINDFVDIECEIKQDMSIGEAFKLFNAIDIVITDVLDSWNNDGS